MKSDFVSSLEKRVKTLEIAGKVYELELENLDVLKAWRDKGIELQAQLNLIMGSDERIVDVVPICIETLDVLLNDGQRIWDECGHSPWALLKLIKDLSLFILAAREEIKKHYGLGF